MAKFVGIMLVLAAGCSSGGFTAGGPEATARAYLESAVDRDYGAVWETLHPEIRALTTRAEWTACAAEDSDGAVDIDIDVGDSYVETGVTYVDVQVSADSAFGEQKAALLFGLLESSEGWGVVLLSGGGDDDDPCIDVPEGFVQELAGG